MKRLVPRKLYGLQGNPIAAQWNIFKSDFFATPIEVAINSSAAVTTGLTLSGAMTTGILVSGAATTAISVTSTVLKGIDFTSATLTQSWDNGFFVCGYGNGAAGTQHSVAATTHYIPLQINVVNIANPTDISQLCAAMLRLDAGTADQARASIDVLAIRSDIAYNVYASTCINASVNISEDIAVTAATQGIFVQMTGDGAITCSNPVNVLEAVYHQTTGGGGCDNVAQFAMNGLGCTITSILNLRTVQGTCTNALYIEPGVAITNAINISDASNVTNFVIFNEAAGCVSLGDVDPEAAPSEGGLGATGHIVIDVAGTPYYIPIFDTIVT